MICAGRVLGGLALLRAVDVVGRGPGVLPEPAWAVAVGAFVVAAGLLTRDRAPARASWTVLLVAGVALLLDAPVEGRRQHLVLLMLVALAAAASGDHRERLLMWRVQLSALYGVAALAKLNESFLGGDVLAGAVLAAPFWSALLPTPPLAALVLASVGLIAVEVALAVAPWLPRLRRAGLLLAVAFHGATLLLVTDSAPVGLRLVVFGGTALVLHAAGAGLLATGGTLRARWSTAGGPGL